MLQYITFYIDLTIYIEYSIIYVQCTKHVLIKCAAGERINKQLISQEMTRGI